MARHARSATVIVVGLGRFGSALAEELFREGHEVMGIDTDDGLVQNCADFLTFAEVCDATSAETLTQLGVGDATHAVVAIGDSIQASILTTSNLAELEVPDIWAKALTEQHGRILERVGAHNIVFPEGDAGRRVAHRISSKVAEYVELDEGFVLAELTVPNMYVGSAVQDCGMRDAYGVSVVCHKPLDGTFEVTTGNTILGAHDLILVAGPEEAIERFAQISRE
ncbi:MAG: potassium channel family protein [Microthrixaceae bacterium]